MKLVIAEKPSVAGEIAKVIGATKKEHGYYSGNNYYVSWCVGHLIQLADPQDYDTNLKKWSMQSLPVIPDTYKTKVSVKTEDQYKILENLICRDDVTQLICATDAGREGELIFRLVYEKSGSKKPFKRLWISSMEEKAIIDGFNELKDGREYDNLYFAARCRQRADWLVGMNFTRLYTTKYNKLLKVGRVQTPTLNMIVKRQLEIRDFVVKTHYAVIADLGSFKASSKDFDDKKAAENLAEACKGKNGIVVKVEKEERKENPPALYDLTTLQRDANRLLGYSAQQTLDVAQSLYEKKLITYPRTDSRYITADMEASTKKLIDDFVSASVLGENSKDWYDVGVVSMNQIVNDKKVTDHHAIIPTISVIKTGINSLPASEKNILLLIAMRLLISPYAPHLYSWTRVTLDIESEAFTASGKEIRQDGFKKIERQVREIIKELEKEDDSEKTEGNSSLPPMNDGDVFTVNGAEVKTKKTQPPKPYTEDTLLSSMESAGRNIADETLKEAMKNSGLGTPATRANIIENLIKSGYIERQKKQLIPTDTAYTFIELVNEDIKEPELTAEWEKQLGEIESGTRSSSDFMNAITTYVKSLVEVETNEAVSDNKSVFKSDRESLGVCPLCQKNVIELPKTYSCESGRGGCGFTVWRVIAGKNITKAQIKKLLEKRKTDLIKGFKNKAGKEYDAYLILKDDNTIGFEFEKK